MREVARLIVRTLQARDEPAEQFRIAAEVAALCARFPVPGLSDAADVLVQGSLRRS